MKYIGEKYLKNVIRIKVFLNMYEQSMNGPGQEDYEEIKKMVKEGPGGGASGREPLRRERAIRYHGAAKS